MLWLMLLVLMLLVPTLAGLLAWWEMRSAALTAEPAAERAPE